MRVFRVFSCSWICLIDDTFEKERELLMQHPQCLFVFMFAGRKGLFSLNNRMVMIKLLLRCCHSMSWSLKRIGLNFTHVDSTSPVSDLGNESLESIYNIKCCKCVWIADIVHTWYVYLKMFSFPICVLFFESVLSSFINQKRELNVHRNCQKDPDISSYL